MWPSTCTNVEVCDYAHTHKPHTPTRSNCTDGKVAGVISRIRRTQEKKNLRSTQTNLTPNHTHTRRRFVSHPPGCLLARHPNPLKITFSYYPNNGGTECNFNSCFRKKKKTRRGGTGHRAACSLAPLACSLLRAGEASREEEGGREGRGGGDEEEVRETER